MPMHIHMLYWRVSVCRCMPMHMLMHYKSVHVYLVIVPAVFDYLCVPTYTCMLNWRVSVCICVPMHTLMRY